jgi:NhaP-type Na+/H+ or K+/H+ antiporter/mannitol/fructose-specific phosphotransferase system IIA component (Ntr-type)
MHSHEILTTFTAASALGVCLFTLAQYLRVSAIAVLLIGGIVAGPQVLGIVQPDSLGSGLSTLISLAVAIILFEGGLTLDLKGYRSASKEIFRVLTLGVIVTWVGSALLLRLFFRFDIAFCLFAASLIIVTGPTVIGPLLNRIRVNKRLHHILHWEGVLIDPIGVFIALLSFEFYVSTNVEHQLIISDFLMRFLSGALLGLAFGFLLDLILRRGWIREDHTNIFVLAMAMLNFGVADLVIAESGLLSVTIAGLVLGSRNTPNLRNIISYKVELKDFLIGLLFVLLAANLNLAAFLEYGWKLLAVVVGIMLVVRPLNIFLSMHGSSVSHSEKLFLSWIAPRGIVAASMASAFTLELKSLGADNAVFLETFTYSVIAGTVIVQGLTAGALGRYLGVLRPPSKGWIIIGSHAVGRQVARFLKRFETQVVLIDTNARDVRTARREGLLALSDDAMLMDPDRHVELYGCGNLLAITPNPDLNRMLCRRWSEILEEMPYRWEPAGYETDKNRHLLVGRRIWDNVPLSRWMSLEGDATPLRRIEATEGEPGENEQILFAATADGLRIGASKEVQKEDTAWLLYTPPTQSQQLILPLAADDVVFSDLVDLRELYGEMIGHLKDRVPKLDPDELLEEMWKREEDYTSLLGHGIALPHVWTPQVQKSVLMVARPTSVVVCPLTRSKIEIVFMLISPLGNPDEHLRNLSQIARLVGTESRRASLLAAESPGELFTTIASNE